MHIEDTRRRPVERRAAPESAAPHPWSAPTLEPPSAFIEQGLSRELLDGAKAAEGRDEETLSLLRGDRFIDPGTDLPYAVALWHVTGPLQTSAAHVQFDPEGFGAVARALDGLPRDYLIVGWFHSHLGLGCRPSTTDRATHHRYFSATHQFALIVDARLREAAAYTLEAGDMVSRAFAVFAAGGDQA